MKHVYTLPKYEEMRQFKMRWLQNGGERGIRTLDTLAGITVFETVLFNHSSTSPAAMGKALAIFF
jgi:hypothetical protein